MDPQAARYPGWSPYCYALGNPIRLKDAEGAAVEDFVYGLAAAVLNNFTIGGSPRPDPQNYPSSGRTDLQIGLAVGDVASAIGGAAQTLAGASAAGLSVAAAPAGAISLAALPAAAGVAAHGVGVVATAGGNIGKDIAVARQGASPSGAEGSKLETHHQLPNQFKAEFEAVGLKVEDYTITIDKAAHRLKPGGLHTGTESWNRQWGDFFKANPEATKDDILNQLSSMRSQWGLE